MKGLPVAVFPKAKGRGQNSRYRFATSGLRPDTPTPGQPKRPTRRFFTPKPPTPRPACKNPLDGRFVPFPAVYGEAMPNGFVPSSPKNRYWEAPCGPGEALTCRTRSACRGGVLAPPLWGASVVVHSSPRAHARTRVFLILFLLFFRARAIVRENRSNSPFFRVNSPFFRVNLPFSVSYPQSPY